MKKVIFFLSLACACFPLEAGDKEVREGLELELELSKPEFVYGDPIIVNLIARNDTKTKTVRLVGEDSFGGCGYQVDVTDNQNHSLKRMYWYDVDGLVYPMTKYQCKPGQEVRDQVVLQKFHEFPGAGKYSVSCVYRTILDTRNKLNCLIPQDIPIYSKTGKVDYQTNKWATVSRQFNIVVKSFNEQNVMAVATQLFAQLTVEDIKTPRDPATGSAYRFTGGDNYTNGLDGLMPVTDIKARLDAVKALGYFSGSGAVYSNVISHLLLALQDTNKALQYEALASLSVIWKNPSASALSVNLPIDQRGKIVGSLHKLSSVEAAVIAIGKIGDESSIPYLMKATLPQHEYGGKPQVPYALEQIGLRGGKEKALEALKTLLNDSDAKIRQKSEEAIKRLESQSDIPNRLR